MKAWENVEKREHFGCDTYSYFEELSNGQILAVYFQEVDYFTFNCAICIMDSKEDCVKWCGGETDKHDINGRCGLEGLALAYRILKWFIQNRLPEYYKLRIHGVGKRGRAYKYVERLGFKQTVKTSEDSVYVFEN